MKKNKRKKHSKWQDKFYLPQIIVFVLICMTALVVAVNFRNSTVLKPLVIYIFLTVLFILVWMKDKIVLPLNIVSILVFIYLIWNGMSIFFSGFYYDNLMGFNHLLAGIILYFSIIIISEKWKSDWFIRLLILLASVLAMYAIAQRFGFSPFSWDASGRARHLQQFGNLDGFRVFASLGHPNYFAGFLAFCVPLILHQILQRENKMWFYSSILSLVLVIGGLVLTLSRGGWIAAFVAALLFGVFMLFKSRLKISKFIYGIIAFLLMLILLSVVMPDAFTNRLQSLFNMEKTVDLGRKNIWAGTLEMFTQKPITGWGIGTFRQIFPQFRPSDYKLFGEDIVNHAHNEYLEILVETGVVGLLIFALVLAFLFWGFAKNKGKNDDLSLAILAGLCGLLVQNLVSITLRTDTVNLIFWMAVAYLSMNIPPVKRLQIKGKLGWIGKLIILSILLLFVVINTKIAISDYYLGRGVDYGVQANIARSRNQERAWKGLLAESEIRLKKAINFNQYNKMAYYKLGVLYMDLEKTPEAIYFWEKLVNISPYYPEARKNLGLAYGKADQVDKAIESLTLSLKSIYDKDTHFALAGLYEQKGEVDSLLTYYEKCIPLAAKEIKRIQSLNAYPEYKKQQISKLTSQLQHIYKKLGINYSAHNLWHRALEPYKEATWLVPNESFFHYQLGIAFRNNGDCKDGITAQKQTLKLISDDSPVKVKVLNELSKCYIQLNQLELAQEAFKEIIVLAPQSPQAEEAKNQLEQLNF